MGRIHPEARATTQKLIKALQRAGRFEDDATAATMVWRAATTAVLLRAASPIARHKKPVCGEMEEADEFTGTTAEEGSTPFLGPGNQNYDLKAFLTHGLLFAQCA